MEKLDVSGNRLKRGDKVATIFYGYSKLEIAMVDGFTDKKIRVIDSSGNSHTKFPHQLSLIHTRG